MDNHLLDGGEESQNYKNFQEYPSFDNGILDLEVVNPESVNPVNLNAESVNSGSMDNGILDIGTMDSGIVNPGNENAETIYSGFVYPENMDSGIVNPGNGNAETVNSGFVYPENVDSGSVNPGAVNSGTMNSEIPVQQSFDPVIPDTSHSYEQAIVPGTIDSRSFTHTEAEWQQIQAGAAAVDYVDSTDSWDNYRERKPESFFRTFLAFFVSIIVAGAFAFINVMVYDIEYISTLQCLLCILPSAFMFTCFYYMTGRRAMAVVEGILLIVLNEILSYIMFHSVMVHNIQKIYPELSFKEAWQFVKIMKAIAEMQKVYYLHFAIIFGIASLLGIIYGIMGIRGLLDGVQGRRRRY